MSASIVTLDVRQEIRAGIEPFTKIMKTVGGLEPGQELRLLAPFKPLPLFSVLARKGFSHREQLIGDHEWEVIFSRTPEPARAEPTSATAPESNCGCSAAPEPVVVDARGLEPPQPLVTILEAVASLPVHATMRARTDRRPMHLYSHLAERGYVGESEEQPDGSFITHIRRA